MLSNHALDDFYDISHRTFNNIEIDSITSSECPVERVHSFAPKT